MLSPFIHYLGGSKEDYDVIKAEQDSGYTTGVTDGNFQTWQDLWNKGRVHAAAPTNENYFKMKGLAADGLTPTADPVLLDEDNLIDYLLLTFWTGNLDGAVSNFLGNDKANNWFGSRRRNGREGFRFFAHDFEHSFFNSGEDRTGPYTTPNQSDFSYSNPMFLHQDLLGNIEYRLRFADRVQKHMFNGGALTATRWTGRFNSLAATIDRAIIAESARWGDAKRATPLTRLDWLNAKNSLIDSYVPSRGTTVLSQLRNDGLYPSIGGVTIAPFGGYVASGSAAVITASAGTIYYMRDGSDPRAIGGAPKPGAQTHASGSQFVFTGSGERPLRLRALAGTTWSALTEAIFLVDTVAASATNLAISEIMYHPAAATAAEIAAGFMRRFAADDVIFTIEAAESLQPANWDPLATVS